MKSLTSKRFYKDNVTDEWLRSAGFRYSRYYSDKEDTVYTYRFPVYKYNNTITLECELYIFRPTGEIRFNVYDIGFNNIYPSFYIDGNNRVVDIVNRKIRCKLNELGIKEKNDRNTRYERKKNRRSNNYAESKNSEAE